MASVPTCVDDTACDLNSGCAVIAPPIRPEIAMGIGAETIRLPEYNLIETAPEVPLLVDRRVNCVFIGADSDSCCREAEYDGF